MGLKEDILKKAQSTIQQATQLPAKAPSVPSIPNVPGVPKLSGIAGQFLDAAEKKRVGDAEYLVTDPKGRDGVKTYRGDLQKDGSIKFKQIEADELNILRQKEGAPELVTYQRLQQLTAAQNTPASLTQSISRAKMAETIVAHMGGRDPDTKAIDADAASIAQKGKGVDVGANVTAARADLLEGFKARLEDLNKLTKKGKLGQDDPIPGEANGVTPRQLGDAIKGEISTLQKPIQDAAAVQAFEQQVINAPAAAPAVDTAPKAKGPAVNPLDMK